MRQATDKQKRPELELSDRQSSAIRYLEHGYPHARVRWHYHDEYELHYIVATSGKAFIGDYIGRFTAGSLFLTGPRLPHNWISDPALNAVCPVRDKLVHFDHDVLNGVARLVPEIQEIMPLLERASYGIRFPGRNDSARQRLDRIKETDGAERLGHFCPHVYPHLQPPL